MRDQALAVYGRGDDKGGGLAIEMRQWSADVVLCSDGPSGLSAACQSRLARHNIIVREDKIAGLQIHSDEPYRSSFDIVFEHPLVYSALRCFSTRTATNPQIWPRSWDARGMRAKAVRLTTDSRPLRYPVSTSQAMPLATFCKWLWRHPKVHKPQSLSMPL